MIHTSLKGSELKLKISLDYHALVILQDANAVGKDLYISALARIAGEIDRRGLGSLFPAKILMSCSFLREIK